MRMKFRPWSTLPPDHKDYVAIYIAGLIWVSTYLAFAPAVTYTIVGRISVVLWCSAAIIGALISLYGLLSRDNLIMERFGVTLMMVAPALYSLTQLAIFAAILLYPHEYAAATNAFDRLPIIFLGLWPFLWLNKRRRHLKAQVKAAKNTPLPGEGF
jgi:hypothetical protein